MVVVDAEFLNPHLETWKQHAYKTIRHIKSAYLNKSFSLCVYISDNDYKIMTISFEILENETLEKPCHHGLRISLYV